MKSLLNKGMSAFIHKVVIGIALLGSSLFGEDWKLKEEVDAVVMQALEAFHVPGAAVGIVVDGEIAYVKGYGFSHALEKNAVTENTLFGIGSCTKAFTAFILGQLVDEGRIQWEDPIIKHVPEFRLFDPYATEHATIKDLLTHQTGLPLHNLIGGNLQFSRSDLVARLRYLEPTSSFRQKVQYNNLMYATLGLLIEKVTGQTWEEEVIERIFIPLKMERSNCSIKELQGSVDFAYPHTERQNQVNVVDFLSIESLGPAGSINSSAAEMANWLKMQVSEGKAEEKALIKKETLQAMHRLQVADPFLSTELSDHVFGYGLGWKVWMYKGYYALYHAGDIHGFISQASLLPKEKVGVIVLSNNGKGGYFFVSSVTRSLLDLLLHLEKEDWICCMKEKQEKEQKAFATKNSLLEGKELPSQEALQKYVGSYSHPGYGSIQIDFKGGQLSASYDAIRMFLLYQKEDLFLGKANDLIFEGVSLPFIFSQGEKGGIMELRIPLEPALKPIVFKKSS